MPRGAQRSDILRCARLVHQQPAKELVAVADEARRHALAINRLACNCNVRRVPALASNCADLQHGFEAAALGGAAAAAAAAAARQQLPALLLLLLLSCCVEPLQAFVRADEVVRRGQQHRVVARVCCSC